MNKTLVAGDNAITIGLYERILPPIPVATAACAMLLTGAPSEAIIPPA